MQRALRGIHPDDRVAALTSRSENAVRVKRCKLGIPSPSGQRRSLPCWGLPQPRRTLLLLLALVLLLVYAGWLWTASRVPGVREAGLAELLLSLAAGALVGGLPAEWCRGLR